MAISKRMRYTFPLIALIAIYFLGPSPSRPEYSLSRPVVPTGADALEEHIRGMESKHKVKPDNEARIVWADSLRKKTEYAVIYLHGYSASQEEGNPIHRRFAKTIGANLYLARLADHGIDTTETLLYFTADRLWETAKEALEIGKQLGDKVILVSTSTGGTLSLMLAAEYPDDVHALINLSPNIRINDGAAFLLNNPWGLQIARAVLGGNYRETGADEWAAKYWNKKYRIESLVQLEELLETTMNDETFARVKQPSLTLYYYKDEAHQDPEVRVDKMLEMHEALGTPAEQKKAIAFPAAGAHVIGNARTSKDVEGVYHAMEDFAVHVLHIRTADEQ